MDGCNTGTHCVGGSFISVEFLDISDLSPLGIFYEII